MKYIYLQRCDHKPGDVNGHSERLHFTACEIHDTDIWLSVDTIQKAFIREVSNRLGEKSWEVVLYSYCSEIVSQFRVGHFPTHHDASRTMKELLT